MKILIDYDNLKKQQKQLGIRWVVEKSLNIVLAHSTESIKRVTVKLYGGWYESARLTTLAQQVSAEVMRDFPCITPAITQSGKTISVLTAAELAYSVDIFPEKHLFHTYRKRECPSNLRCKSPTNAGCTEQNCSLDNTRLLFKSGKCPNPNCKVTIKDVIFKNSQKLVDSMITVDLIYAATLGDKHICIVSSDDDFWPATMNALILGCTVYQVHTKSTHSTPTDYISGVPGTYHQNSL